MHWRQFSNDKKANILVTGGDGNIGKEVINQLLSKRDNGLRIVGGVRSIAKKKDIDIDLTVMIR